MGLSRRRAYADGAGYHSLFQSVRLGVNRFPDEVLSRLGAPERGVFPEDAVRIRA